jgi:hypothetical protein
MHPMVMSIKIVFMYPRACVHQNSSRFGRATIVDQGGGIFSGNSGGISVLIGCDGRVGAWRQSNQQTNGYSRYTSLLSRSIQRTL